MAELHTKDIPCEWPSHIHVAAHIYTVIYQTTGLIEPPPPETFTNITDAQAAADGWANSQGV